MGGNGIVTPPGVGAPPARNPKYALPGLEFFGAAPGRDMTLGARLVALGTAGPTAIPANTFQLTTLNLSNFDTWQQGDALYFQKVIGRIVPSDTSGQLQIQSANLLLQVGGIGGYFFGSPFIVAATPRSNVIAISDGEFLITQQDMNKMGNGSTGSVTVQLTIGFLNLDAANPHSVTTQLSVIARHLGHITE